MSEWVPVSKRVPKNDEYKVVTIDDRSGDTPWKYTDVGWYLEEARCWIVHDEKRYDVIAWIPLPWPWRGEKDE